MNLLITGAKSAKAFSLANSYSEGNILMADYGDVPQIPFKGYRFLSIGVHNLETTAHSLLTFCLDHSVNTIVPVYDFEIAALRKSLTLFEEFDIQVILPDAL